MGSSQGVEPSVEIVVGVGNQLRSAIEAEEDGALEAALVRAVSEMLVDLDIDARVAIDTRLWDGEPLLASQSYAVHINGSRCRLPVSSDADAVKESQALAEAVIGGIYENRELMVSRDIATAIRARWAGEIEALSQVSDSTFSSHLQALVRHGVSVIRGRDIYASLDHRSASDATPEDLFEWSVAGAETAGIKIELGPTQHALLVGHDEEIASDADVTSSGSMPEPHTTMAMGDAEVPGTDVASIKEMLETMRQGLFYELGLMLPNVRVQLRRDIDGEAIQFQINDLRSPPMPGLADGELLVNDTVDRLSLIGLAGRPAVNPANGSACAILVGDDANERHIATRAGLTTWSPAEYLVLALRATIRRQAGRLLNRHHVRFALNSLGQGFPSLVRAAERRIPESSLTGELRNLLDEQLSIGDLRGILESLLAARVNCEDGSPVTSEQRAAIRLGMREYISDKYAGDTKTLVVLLLDGETVSRIADDLEHDDPKRVRLIRVLGNEIRKFVPTSQNPPILTRLEIRQSLSRLIAIEFPRTAVLSYQDVSPDLTIQPIGRTRWNGEAEER